MKISVLIPCYNEEGNVELISEKIQEIFSEQLGAYDYEIVFIDNNSSDNTRFLIRKMCYANKKIKAIFNIKNFGQFNSPFYGMLQTSGDCTILMCCDFQDPVELIPKLVQEWENGFKIVAAIKNKSKENLLIRFLRTSYYKLFKKISHVEQIEHFTGFGLYDRTFLDFLSTLNDPIPYLRGVVAEFGWKRKDIYYKQECRLNGKTSNNWFTLYDAAMLSFTSYTKVGLRLASIVGGVLSLLSISIALLFLVLKLLYWDRFVAGMAPVLLGMFTLGAIQIFFIGVMGEYILSMNERLKNRPLVIEEARINFE